MSRASRLEIWWDAFVLLKIILKIEWSRSLTKLAGYCSLKKSGLKNTSTISKLTLTRREVVEAAVKEKGWQHLDLMQEVQIRPVV